MNVRLWHETIRANWPQVPDLVTFSAVYAAGGLAMSSTVLDVLPSRVVLASIDVSVSVSGILWRAMRMHRSVG